jgi:hypothetical protein
MVRPLAGARRHWLFAVLFAVGTALRLLALYAYRPAFEFSGDSYAYLTLARLRQPDPTRPAGYPFLLRLLGSTHRLYTVPATQHAAGLAVGVALYALLVRRLAHPAVAALATAPVLLDAYQLDLEHFVMAETLFTALLVAALLALLWSPRPSVVACALAGALLAAAGLVRTLGVTLAVLALGYVLARRLGAARLVVFTCCLAAPLTAYAVWFHSGTGEYALTGGDGAWLYGRVAPIAECSRLHLTAEERGLCPRQPPADRPGPNYYVWDPTSPRFALTGSERHQNAILAGFAHQVIARQPAAYARTVAADAGHYFLPGRTTDARDWPVGSWRFPTANPPAAFHLNAPLLDFDGGHPARVSVEPAAGWLRAYQRYGYAPGPLLALLGTLAALGALLGLPRPRLPGRGLRRPTALNEPAAAFSAPLGAPRWAASESLGESAWTSSEPLGEPAWAVATTYQGLAALGFGEPASAAAWDADEEPRPSRRARRLARRSGRDPVLAERRRLGADCALLAAMGAAVLIVPSATVCFDFRYLLPVLVLVPPAAALAWRQCALALRREPSEPRRLG